MSIVYDMNKLGVKLLENEMEYGRFTDDERTAIAGALGFEFIRVPYSQHYDSLKMFDDVYKEGDMVYIVYDTGREAYSSYMDGWGDMTSCDINANVDACFDSILEPYVTEYFENIVIPELSKVSHTLRSSFVLIMKKMAELNPYGMDIVIPLMTKEDNTVIVNDGKVHKYTYTPAAVMDVVTRYNYIHRSILSALDDIIIAEILYTVMSHIDHVYLQFDVNDVEQIVCVDEFSVDELSKYIDSFELNDTVIAMRQVEYVTNHISVVLKPFAYDKCVSI